MFRHIALMDEIFSLIKAGVKLFQVYVGVTYLIHRNLSIPLEGNPQANATDGTTLLYTIILR